MIRLVKGIIWLALVVVACTWAIPFIVVGGVMIMTGLALPLGSLLLVIGGLPLSKLMGTAIRHRINIKNS